MMNSPDPVSPYRTPGVHINFVAREVRPAFKTGIPVFVGFGKLTALASRKWDNPWCSVSSWQQFVQSVEMSAHQESYLRYAVRGFFENGGECCIVLPLPDTQPTAEALGELFQNIDSASSGEPGTLRGIMETIEDIDLVCLPDLMMKGICSNRSAALEVQQLVLDHCRKMGDRFAILDALPVRDHLGIEQLMDDRRQLRGSEGALYFPWIQVRGLHWSEQCSSSQNARVFKDTAPLLTNRPNEWRMRLVPPCGHVAGIYARTDARFGVFKAPANEIIEGVWDLGRPLTQDELAELNHSGINCLRISLSRGIRVWGARTLSVYPYDQYISTRRLFTTMVRWIERNMSDLVFETHDESLWRRIRHRMEGYCYELFQKGALKGQAPEEAYFVKCDRELNPAEGRDLGMVISEVGLAAVVPAEFIVVRITHSTSGATATLLS